MAWREKATKDTKSAQAILETSMRNQWAFSAEYKTVQKRMFEIQQGLRPGSDLVILDDEFSPASSQIWEFAMIEKVSGKVLVNTCIEHEKGIDHGAENPFLRHLSYRKAANVFSASRLPMIPRLNADQVASQLRAVGITPNTIILV
jgi:hypothetical protein